MALSPVPIPRNARPSDSSCNDAIADAGHRRMAGQRVGDGGAEMNTGSFGGGHGQRDEELAEKGLGIGDANVVEADRLSESNVATE